MSVPDPLVLSISTPFDFAVSQSISAWFHHLIGTLAPSLALAPSHRSRSVRVAMYCVTVFCLFAMDFLMSVSPASLMAPSRDRYYHSPFFPLRACLPVRLLAAPYRNQLNARSIFGVTTHVSAPNSSTYCTTALKKDPDIRGVAPSLLNILCSLPPIA